MMMDRSRIGFWTRFIALGLAAVFVGSFVVMGIGSTFPAYNVIDLVGGDTEQEQQQQQEGASVQDQVEAAEADLAENPEDPDVIKRAAFLYVQNGNTERANEVLTDGREVAPEDPEMPLIQGQVYQQQAQQNPDEAEELNRQAADAFAAGADLDSENEVAFLAAGDAYEAAGDQGSAIEYWNGYLDLDPEDSAQAEEVQQKISDLLRGVEPEEATDAGGSGGEAAPESTE